MQCKLDSDLGVPFARPATIKYISKQNKSGHA